jgi:hypothetical protein
LPNVASDYLSKATDFQEIKISGFLQATEEIKTVFSGAQKFPFIDLYVHGSWADNTRTPFSDLDDLVIIDRERIKNNKQIRMLEIWLNRVDMKFCRIDPLQHHGHWLIYRDELDNYNESFIPLTVLERAILVQGSKSIDAKINKDLTVEGVKQNLELTLSNIQRLFEKYEAGSINLYEMKGLVGSFLLVPAFAYQCRRNRVTKKWALENSHQIYSEEGYQAIDYCSFVRNNWHTALRGSQYYIYSLTPYFFTNPHFYRRFARHLSPKFPKQAFPLLEECWVKAFIEDSVKYIHD